MQGRRKILFLPRWYPAEDIQNGVFIRKHALAAALNNEVVVIYAHPGKNQSSVKEVRNGNLTEIIIYYKTSFLKPLNFLLYVRALFNGWRRIKRTGFFPDICHVHVLNRPALLALRLRRKYKVPMMISEHWSGYLTGKFEQRGLLSGLFTAYAIRKAAMVTVVSETLKQGMLKCGLEAEYRILPNVVETLPGAWKLPPPTGKFRYLVVADLRDDLKNISGVIRAFKTVYTSDKQTELVIAGDGPDRKYLEDLAGKGDAPIHFRGRLSNDQVLELIPTAHVLIINSKNETFSIVTPEAIFSGRPAISTRCGGPEQFINEHNGILIDKEKDGQLSEAMKRIKTNYADYPAEKVRSSVENHFTLEKVAEKLDGYYEEVLGKYVM